METMIIRIFIRNMATLSPLFISIIMNQIDTLTDRKLGEILGIESSLDIRLVKKEIKDMLDTHDR